MMFYAVRQDGGNWYQVDVCYKENKNYYLCVRQPSGAKI